MSSSAVSIAPDQRNQGFPIPEVRKDKKETKSAKKVVKSTVKESMVVNTTPLKFSKRKEGRAEKKDDGSKRRRLTLKERQKKVYPFPDSDIADMLEQLLEKQLIQLLECKRPEQAGKVDDLNYCKYHRVISHPIEKYFLLKELILRLAREKKIELDLEEVAQTNHATTMIMSEALSPRLIFEQRESLVQFGTFELVVVRFHQEVAPEDSQEKERLIEEDDEWWTIVTRRKKRKFLGDHQDENPGVVACHAINATEEESISLTASSSSAPTATYESTPYCISIDFSDEDLLLGSKLHNRPLYVSGYVREQRVDRILVDNGLAVNIMPKSTMRQLGILMEELSNSKLVIQGFNQGSQRVIGMIRLELIIGDLKTSALFHVIDSRTTYKLLLGRPWIHGNGVVTSTLHQCFKFYQDGVKKVEADSNPFSEAESHFADAKFYLKNDCSPEAVSVEVPLVNREDNLQLKSLTSKELHKSTGTFHSGKSEASTSTAKSVILMDEKTSNPPILRYVPLSRSKKGESPFVESPQGLKVGDIEILKERFTTPLTKITKQEIKIDLTEASLPQRQTKDGFDPKAYKLMAKAGYDFITHTEFKSLKIHEQPKLLREGHVIPMSRKGLGYKLPGPIRITRKGKEKVVDSNHITVKEVDIAWKKKKASMTTKPSAFKRLSITKKKNAQTPRASIINHLGDGGLHVQTDSSIDTKKKESTSRVSVWHRIKHIDVESHHGKEFPCEVKGEREIRSNVPSRMKRKTFVTLNTSQGSLKVKRHDVILTNPEKEDSEQGEGEISCHHITILEELEIETSEEDAEDAPQSLEDGGQSTVDKLKEVNLGTIEEPRQTFISASLSSEEEELIPQVEVEVNKLLEAGFIREVKYPTWIANIVLVRKKNGQLHVFVDFRDLNNACPKDDFLLPITEIMVDATTGHEALSFMDGSSGYNQIRMVLLDEEMTAFRTPKEIYCYKVMPFGLKNAGATYQRAMQNVFDDMLHKYVECYLRMNPLKCAFGVTSGKFLGFIVRHQGIEIDQSKIDAIQKMPRPKSLHDLRSLQGRLAYIRRFISNLASRCQPFQKLMRKGENFVWNEACQNDFDSIKKYLLNPLVLGALVPGEPLILYIAAQERSLGALLAQEKEKGKERALYYLSKTLVGAEVNYSSIEKMCLALFFAIDKLRHYMQAFTVHLVAKADPIKYVLSRPIISGRLAKWAVILQQYDIVYISQKTIKGQALVDFLADHPIPSDWKLCEDLPDDEVFFTEVVEPWTIFVLAELCSNNVAEYEALIIGLQMVLEIGVSFIEIYGDSKLIINQLSLQYDVKHENLKPYFTYARQLMEMFDSVMLEHVPRIENKRADALANLATALMMPDNEVNITTSHLIDEEDRRQSIIEYLEHGKLPKDSRHKTEEESIKALEEAHAGVCGAHQSGPKLQFQLRRMSYYWPKMVQDSMDYAKKCEACQYHANFIHQPLEPLHPTMASWPFEAWGLDLVGPITPKSSAGHFYILAATDYFSKWTEAIPLREAKKENVANFIRTHIIYRYGIPHRIVTDNGRQFSNSMIDKLCEKFKFKQYKSSMYNAAANGLAEEFDKTLCNLLKKIVCKSKRDWQERIGEALWAYRTTHRTPTEVTPYSLVYGLDAVLPLEREIPSLRMAVQEELTIEDNVKLRLQELEALDEKRLEAQQALECYQARMSKAFDKHVKPRSFQVGDLVLAVRRPIVTTRHTGNKFTPKWDGPYIVKEVYINGAYKIVD
ncbi:uncharacterized protein E5676_scaffold968G00270 [Cucumis melo var. makuwa]|uniref:RNA-directed DNA polymerase n=1 Tax=Cucumis melo var. makuwa TaxID=1194695 RepID=A0A5D3BV77_CUCMM|nr:uncharacterized protein E5676_scaffold968G00270 [Cucumis melo var. makuwa]